MSWCIAPKSTKDWIGPDEWPIITLESGKFGFYLYSSAQISKLPTIIEMKLTLQSYNMFVDLEEWKETSDGSYSYILKYEKGYKNVRHKT